MIEKLYDHFFLTIRGWLHVAIIGAMVTGWLSYMDVTYWDMLYVSELGASWSFIIPVSIVGAFGTCILHALIMLPLALWVDRR